MKNKVAQEILAVIYTWFRDHGGEWPSFDNIERRLNRYKRLDAAKMMERVPRAFLKPLNYVDGRPDPAGKLVLRVAGVARCQESYDDTQNFVAAVRWLAQQDRHFDPPSNRLGCRMPITAEQLANELRLPLFSDSSSIERLMALLIAEGLVSCDEYA